MLSKPLLAALLYPNPITENIWKAEDCAWHYRHIGDIGNFAAFRWSVFYLLVAAGQDGGVIGMPQSISST